ncbi:MAG TPA: PPK2 family polyphosphate kinase [Terracidiphilus sp.]|nr:PPK2 family polyphosphate kinase [Terracidiphilus sp.]
MRRLERSEGSMNGGRGAGFSRFPWLTGDEGESHWQSPDPAFPSSRVGRRRPAVARNHLPSPNKVVLILSGNRSLSHSKMHHKNAMGMARDFSINPKLWERYVLNRRVRLRLRDVSTNETGFCIDKKSAQSALKEYKHEIDRLLYVLSAQKMRSVLVIFQGMDASGKDGAIRHVLTGLNPQHCKVTSFEEPSGEEIDHDYLWRIYRATPAKGQLGAFNRSHYEDLLVPRVRGLLSARGVTMRLRQICDMERIWVENGAVIRKFFFHISRKEQADRFLARLEDPTKHWKVKESDFVDRKLWSKFQSVYEEVLPLTSTPQAPWYVIPSDHKWYRDIAVAGIVLRTLQGIDPHFPKPPLDRKHLKI